MQDLRDTPSQTLQNYWSLPWVMIQKEWLLNWLLVI